MAPIKGKMRTKINPLASFPVSSSLTTPRRPPPSLTLLDESPPRLRRRDNVRKLHKKTRCTAVKYRYNANAAMPPCDECNIIEHEDGRTFVDWLFLRPFRCKQRSTTDNTAAIFNSIASIFSRPDMPSAAELLCGSINGALELERVLSYAVGILKEEPKDGVVSISKAHLLLSELCFKAGREPLVRYTNGEEEYLSNVGIASEEACNTMKNICGFKTTDDHSNNNLTLFTKQQVTCPINKTLHTAEFISNAIVFRVGRRQADNECKTVIRDICHRYLRPIHENDDSLICLINGPPRSGKSTALREFRKTLSKSFHGWNIINGNSIANSIATQEDEFSSCLKAYTKDIINSKRKRKLPHVILLDDLSLVQGIPMLKDIARLGIHVIATVGNGNCDIENNTENQVLSALAHVKAMVLEISPNNKNNQLTLYRTLGSSSRKKKVATANDHSRYRIISMRNSEYR